MRTMIALVVGSLILMTAGGAGAHCQIPCGIYDDHMRFHMIEEHIQTIEKSMKSITELSGAETKDYNQIVRWVNNKDAHAGEIEEIVSFYFLAQRVKPVTETSGENYDRYTTQVRLLHELLVNAMKAKQSTDLAVCTRLRQLLAEFETSYFEPQKG